MQPMTVLTTTLEQCGNKNHHLFSLEDFLVLFPDFTVENLRMLLSRGVQKGILERVCKGIYLYPKAAYDPSLMLFAVAAKLRCDHFNYVSFETVLSHCGLISQIPLGWIVVMTRGRRGIINCGRFGSVEFIHTESVSDKKLSQLHLDSVTGMWWASPQVALQDMKKARRPFDLVDQEALCSRVCKEVWE